jgi:hypothetical protein
MNPTRLHAALQLIFPAYFLMVTRSEREAAPGSFWSIALVALLAVWMLGALAGLLVPRWKGSLWLMLVGALGPVLALALHCLGVLLGLSDLRSLMTSKDLILAVFIPIIILLPGLVFAAVNAYHLYMRNRAVPAVGL